MSLNSGNIGNVRPTIDYLRISVTDRCNFRCTYCMPPEGVRYRHHSEILRYEEILRFTEAAASLGISRVRVTGGEPLVRRGCTQFIASLAVLPGIEDVALTTNGLLLARDAAELKDAGLTRVNISIDSLDPERFAAITRGGKLADVLTGLDAALEHGLRPVKVNAVMHEGIEEELDAFVALAHERPVHVRFIEFMPIGRQGDGELKFVSREQLAGRLLAYGELLPAESPGGAGPARYFRFADAAGTIGFISAMSEHFCGSCNRLRLTADGKLRNCLFSHSEVDIRPWLQPGASRDELARVILDSMNSKRFDRDGEDPGCRSMSQIGG